MKIAHRLGAHCEDEYIDNYIERIVKYKGSGDEVWFATLYGFPTLEKHKEYAKKCGEAAKKFRDNGIKVSMQLSNSIGHGLYMSSADCTGVVYEGSPIEPLVGFDGESTQYSFCWRGDYFKSYVKEQLKYYMNEIMPESVWFDDDYRIQNHFPVKFGCFCDNCIKKFNEENKSSFTREELVEEILHGDLKWREAWIKFIREGLYKLTYELGKLICDIRPGTERGWQGCSHGAYDGYGFAHIFDAMRDASGKPAMVRPGGGVAAYVDHDPHLLLEKNLHINWQNAMLPDYVKVKCPEVENLPFTAFGKTAAGTAFETSLYLVSGNTDMSYSMLMHVKEPWAFYDQFFKLYSEHRKYWERLSEANKDTYQTGLQYFISKDIWKKELAEDEGFDELNKEPVADILQFLRWGMPISYDKKDDSVLILYPESAKCISKEDVEYLKGKNVVTDGEAMDILISRGFDFGIKTKAMDVFDTIKIHEIFEKHPVNEGMPSSYSQSYHAKGRVGAFAVEPTWGDVELIAKYNTSRNVKSYTSMEDMPLGMSELILKNKEGGKWAIFAYSFWKYVIPTCKRNQILNAVNYISDNAICAKLETPVQAILLPRKNQKDKLSMVSVINCTIGESGEIVLRLKNVTGEKFTFMSQYNGEKELVFEKDGDDYLVTMPSLNPWSTGTIFID